MTVARFNAINTHRRVEVSSFFYLTSKFFWVVFRDVTIFPNAHATFACIIFGILVIGYLKFYKTNI